MLNLTYVDITLTILIFVLIITWTHCLCHIDMCQIPKEWFLSFKKKYKNQMYNNNNNKKLED